MLRRGIQRGKAPALLQLLKNYREREASDPRDKIYALLGIAGDLSIYRIVPDYRLPFEEVYKATALQLILTYRSLEILNLNPRSSQSSGLPSWTPDWRALPKVDRDMAIRCPYERNLGSYRASGRMPFLVCRRESDLLCVNGLYFDEIAEISEVLDVEHGAALFKTLTLWEQVISYKQRTEKAYVGGGDWIGAYFRIMTADLIMELRSEVTKHEIPVDVLPIARDIFNFFRQKSGLVHKLVGCPEHAADPDIVQTPEEHTKRLATLQMAFQNRRLFLTKRGYLGTAAPATRLGDTVHILCAAKVPMVLRPGSVTFMGRRTGGYQVVGDTYIHGVMDGEACDGRRSFMPHLIY